MAVEIFTKVWDRAGIELATPVFEVRHLSVARHDTNCITLHGCLKGVLSSVLTHGFSSNVAY